jgi:class 3 adenylate cyclase
MPIDVTSLTMTEIIRLQDLLSKELTRRFARAQALAFSDVVGSTAYFAQHGNEAGRQLQQRHVDLIREALRASPDGRIVDQIGDGAFLVFDTVESACEALTRLLELVATDNAARPEVQRMRVRLALHWATVLTDGVNLASRILGTADPGEIRLTREAYSELPPSRRARCVPMPPAMVKGIAQPVETLRLEWQDAALFPDVVSIAETGEEVALPPRDTITFGRLKQDGIHSNDIVLALPDEALTNQISRWHFELRRSSAGYVLRQVSSRITEVDGQAVPRGGEVPIRHGSVVRVGEVLTLTFRSTVGTRPVDQRTANA